MKMNKFGRLVPGLILALTIALAGISYGQNASQSTANKKADSCCSCCGDSCPMMKDGAMKNHATSADKHDCYCCGDSCSMKKDGAMKNHATASDKHECCCSDSCSMTKKGAMKNHAATSDKHECCCCGDSCEMKDMKDMKKP